MIAPEDSPSSLPSRSNSISGGVEPSARNDPSAAMAASRNITPAHPRNRVNGPSAIVAGAAFGNLGGCTVGSLHLRHGGLSDGTPLLSCTLNHIGAAARTLSRRLIHSSHRNMPRPPDVGGSRLQCRGVNSLRTTRQRGWTALPMHPAAS